MYDVVAIVEVVVVVIVVVEVEVVVVVVVMVTINVWCSIKIRSNKSSSNRRSGSSSSSSRSSSSKSSSGSREGVDAFEAERRIQVDLKRQERKHRQAAIPLPATLPCEYCQRPFRHRLGLLGHVMAHKWHQKDT